MEYCMNLNDQIKDLEYDKDKQEQFIAFVSKKFTRTAPDEIKRAIRRLREYILRGCTGKKGGARRTRKNRRGRKGRKSCRN